MKTPLPEKAGFHVLEAVSVTVQHERIIPFLIRPGLGPGAWHHLPPETRPGEGPGRRWLLVLTQGHFPRDSEREWEGGGRRGRERGNIEVRSWFGSVVRAPAGTGPRAEGRADWQCPASRKVPESPIAQRSQLAGRPLQGGVAGTTC